MKILKRGSLGTITVTLLSSDMETYTPITEIQYLNMPGSPYETTVSIGEYQLSVDTHIALGDGSRLILLTEEALEDLKAGTSAIQQRWTMTDRQIGRADSFLDLCTITTC